MPAKRPSKTEKKFWGGNIPWITAKDMNVKKISKSGQTVTEEGVRNGTRMMPTNTIFILVRGMTLLKNIPICISTTSITFNQDIKALTVKKTVNPLFLLYLLMGYKNTILNMVERAGHGTGKLTTESLKSLLMPIPPLPEQRQIASILSTVDEKLEILRIKKDQYSTLKKGLMQTLLTGRIRVKV